MIPLVSRETEVAIVSHVPYQSRQSRQKTRENEQASSQEALSEIHSNTVQGQILIFNNSYY